MSKKAILAVSFGTSHYDTLEKTIAAIEKNLADAFPERDLFRAFTSSVIMCKLEKEGNHIDNVSQALDRLQKDGYTDVIIQPTHVLGGEEYEKLVSLARPYHFDKFSMGTPLLTTREDHQAVAEALLSWLPSKKDGAAVVLMGHGSEHPANTAYAALEYRLHDMGRKDIFIGTVEGYPGIEEVCRRLEECGNVASVCCYPFMIVAGDHAKNDLAGEEPDSWASILKEKGYQVSCVLRGLGENKAIQELFAKHAKGSR